MNRLSSVTFLFALSIFGCSRASKETSSISQDMTNQRLLEQTRVLTEQSYQDALRSEVFSLTLDQMNLEVDALRKQDIAERQRFSEKITNSLVFDVRNRPSNLLVTEEEASLAIIKSSSDFLGSEGDLRTIVKRWLAAEDSTLSSDTEVVDLIKNYSQRLRVALGLPGTNDSGDQWVNLAISARPYLKARLSLETSRVAFSQQLAQLAERYTQYASRACGIRDQNTVIPIDGECPSYSSVTPLRQSERAIFKERVLKIRQLTNLLETYNIAKSQAALALPLETPGAEDYLLETIWSLRIADDQRNILADEAQIVRKAIQKRLRAELRTSLMKDFARCQWGPCNTDQIDLKRGEVESSYSALSNLLRAREQSIADSNNRVFSCLQSDNFHSELSQLGEQFQSIDRRYETDLFPSVQRQLRANGIEAEQKRSQIELTRYTTEERKVGFTERLLSYQREAAQASSSFDLNVSKLEASLDVLELQVDSVESTIDALTQILALNDLSNQSSQASTILNSFRKAKENLATDLTTAKAIANLLSTKENQVGFTSQQIENIETFCKTDPRAANSIGRAFCLERSDLLANSSFLTEITNFLDRVQSSENDIFSLSTRCTREFRTQSSSTSSFCQAVELLATYLELKSLDVFDGGRAERIEAICSVPRSVQTERFCVSFRQYRTAMESRNRIENPSFECAGAKDFKSSYDLRFCAIKDGKKDFSKDIQVIDRLFPGADATDFPNPTRDNLIQALADQCKDRNSSAFVARACAYAERFLELSNLACLSNPPKNSDGTTYNLPSCPDIGAPISGQYAEIANEINRALTDDKDTANRILTELDALIAWIRSTGQPVNRYVPKNSTFDPRGPTLFTMVRKNPIIVDERGNPSLTVQGYRCATEKVEQEFEFQSVPEARRICIRLTNEVLGSFSSHGLTPVNVKADNPYRCGVLYIPPSQVDCFDVEPSLSKITQFSQQICTASNLAVRVFSTNLQENVCSPLQEARLALETIESSRNLIGLPEFIKTINNRNSDVTRRADRLLNSVQRARDILARDISAPAGQLRLSQVAADNLQRANAAVNGRIGSLKGEISDLKAGIRANQSTANAEERIQINVLNRDLAAFIDTQTQNLQQGINEINEAYGDTLETLMTAKNSLRTSFESNLNKLKSNIYATEDAFENRIDQQNREIDSFLLGLQQTVIVNSNQLANARREKEIFNRQIEQLSVERQALDRELDIILNSNQRLQDLVNTQVGINSEQFKIQQIILQQDLDLIDLRRQEIELQERSYRQAYAEETASLTLAEQKIRREQQYWDRLCQINYNAVASVELVDELAQDTVRDMESAYEILVSQLREAISLARVSPNVYRNIDLIERRLKEMRTKNQIREKLSLADFIRPKIEEVLSEVKTQIYTTSPQWMTTKLTIPLFPSGESTTGRPDLYLTGYYQLVSDSFRGGDFVKRFREMTSRLNQCFTATLEADAMDLDARMASELSCSSDEASNTGSRACLALQPGETSLAAGLLASKDPGTSQSAKLWYGDRLRSAERISDVSLKADLYRHWAARKFYETFRRHQLLLNNFNRIEDQQPSALNPKKRHRFSFNLGPDIYPRASEYFLVDAFVTGLKNNNTNSAQSLPFGIKLETRTVIPLDGKDPEVFEVNFSSSVFIDEGILSDSDLWTIPFQGSPELASSYFQGWESSAPSYFVREMRRRQALYQQRGNSILGGGRGLPASNTQLSVELLQNRNRMSNSDPWLAGLVLTIDLARPLNEFRTNDVSQRLFVSDESKVLPLSPQGDLLLSDLFVASDENLFPGSSVMRWLLEEKTSELEEGAARSNCNRVIEQLMGEDQR